MPNLMKYGLLSTTDNGMGGYLAVACCDFCGKKFGSTEEAKACERKHIMDALFPKGGPT